MKKVKKKVKLKVHPNHKAKYWMTLEDERRTISFKRVTDIVNEFENKDWLVGWHKSEAEKFMIDQLSGDGIGALINNAIKDGKIGDDGLDRLRDKLNSIQKNALEEARRKSDEAKIVGGQVHDLIEKYVDGQSVVLDYLSKEVLTAFSNFLKWEKKNVKRWVCQEVVVWRDIKKTFVRDEDKKGWKKGWGVAGRFDAIVILKDGRKCIVDFKTSKESKDGYYQSAREQLAIYYGLCNYCWNLGYESYVIKTEKTESRFDVQHGEIDCAMMVRLDKTKNDLFEVVEMEKDDLEKMAVIGKKMWRLFFNRIIEKTEVNQKKAKKKSIAKKAEVVA